MNKEEIANYIATSSEIAAISIRGAYDPNLVLANTKLRATLFLIIEFSSVTAVSNLTKDAKLKLTPSKAQLNINGDKMICKSFSLK